MKKLKLSLNAAAREFGVSKDTILRRCKDIGIQTGGDYTIGDVHRALAGDLKFERSRLERARANLLERRDREESRQSVDWETVRMYLTTTFVNPCLSALDTCKDQEWVEKVFKPMIKQSVSCPRKSPRRSQLSDEI